MVINPATQHTVGIQPVLIPFHGPKQMLQAGLVIPGTDLLVARAVLAHEEHQLAARQGRRVATQELRQVLVTLLRTDAAGAGVLTPAGVEGAGAATVCALKDHCADISTALVFEGIYGLSELAVGLDRPWCNMVLLGELLGCCQLLAIIARS